MRKNNKFFILILFVSLRIFSQEQQPNLPIIPFPKECKVLLGKFMLSPETKIVVNSSTSKNEVEFFNDYLNKYYNIRLQVVQAIPKDNNYILFEIPDWESGLKENYHLTIDEKHISILAEGNSAGNLYAIQTLIQLLPPEKSQKLFIPCVKIKDAPQIYMARHAPRCLQAFFFNSIY
jgi:hexosaminidase